MTRNDVYSFIVNIALGGGALTVIVLYLLRHLAVNWLDSKFEQRLKLLEHEQSQELEKLKLKLTKSFDRAVKLHQCEFKILPYVWSKIDDAYWNVRGFLSALQEYPDLSRMTPQQLDEFISKCDLPEWQKQVLRGEGESDKTLYFIDNIYWYRLRRVKVKINNASKALSTNSIFIREDTRKKFDNLISIIFDCVVEDELNHRQNSAPRLSKARGRLGTESDELRSELEKEIRIILWSHEHDAA